MKHAPIILLAFGATIFTLKGFSSEYDYLLGRWACESSWGSHFIKEFKKIDGDIQLDNTKCFLNEVFDNLYLCGDNSVVALNNEKNQIKIESTLSLPERGLLICSNDPKKIASIKVYDPKNDALIKAA